MLMSHPGTKRLITLTLANIAVTCGVQPLSILLVCNSYQVSRMSSEAVNQQNIRLAAPHYGSLLWRNNVGACRTDDGRQLRFGLGNDSAKINRELKSSDLIGIRPVVITPLHVGMTIGQFLAVEVKSDEFVARESDSRYVAQRNFHQCVKNLGGDAMFVKSVIDVWGNR